MKRWPARAAMAWLAAALIGCGGSDDPSPKPPPRVGGPSETPVGARCNADLTGIGPVVYVSGATGNDSPTCGHRVDNPCQTIQTGIFHCELGKCAVLVRYGRYATSETIQLLDGVSVYGACNFDPETMPDRPYRTWIDATPAPGTPAVQTDGLKSPTRLVDLVIANNDETANGSASIALALNGTTGLTLSNVVLMPGVGGPGTKGAAPAPASPGGNGGNGSNSPGGGGAGGGGACPQQPGSAGGGGKGGNTLAGSHGGCLGTCACTYPNRDNGVNDDLGQDGAASDGVPGGPGSRHQATGGFFCTGPSFDGNFNGAPGGSGHAGSCSSVSGGTAASSYWGALSADAWSPGQGGPGGTGNIGSGGGGGSAGGFCLIAYGFTGTNYPGVPAAGGGGGGCGGNGGPGGQQGGASIGLLLSQSTFTLGTGNVIVPAPGGPGGPGADGGAGGSGGTGGTGSQAQFMGFQAGGTQYCPAPSGNGGSGGNGGPGAGGAGGNGGPSIGIALEGGSAAPGSDGVYAAQAGSAGGPPGSGGAGGYQNCSAGTGSQGGAGKAAGLLDFDNLPP